MSISSERQHPRHRVVIIGGGFAGLNAAQSLRRAPVDVTLIDRRNYHLFQPLLYQVATGGLSAGNIAAPLRSILSRQKNVNVVWGDVQGIEPNRRVVFLQESEIPYDTLLVCAGAKTSYFGKDEWQTEAPGLKSIEDALAIRHRVLSAFERAELLSDPVARQKFLTFVVVGGGPTGVELSGTLAEIADHTLKNDFRHIDPTEAKIILIDAGPEILGMFAPELVESARKRLLAMGVDILNNSRVMAVRDGAVEVSRGGELRTIEAETIIWAAGVTGNSLGRKVAEVTGAEVDRGGRVAVEPDLSIKGHPEILVLGDLASAKGADGKPLPGVAPVAIQQGKYAAKLIRARLRNETLPPFVYKDLGSMATIGRSAAIAQLGNWKFKGMLAWLMWLFVHLMQLVNFESRILVFIQWAWNYLTFSRSSRLITEPHHVEHPRAKGDVPMVTAAVSAGGTGHSTAAEPRRVVESSPAGR